MFKNIQLRIRKFNHIAINAKLSKANIEQEKKISSPNFPRMFYNFTLLSFGETGDYYVVDEKDL